MDERSPLTITPPSPCAAQALRQALARYGASGAISAEDMATIEISDPPPVPVPGAGGAAEAPAPVFKLVCGGRESSLSAPLRLGVLLEKVRALKAAPLARHLTCGVYRLDLVGRTWSGPEGSEGLPSAELTDREAALLEALIRAPDHKLERADLLERVWGYHKEAETHTLETHIYRLRRKIERDAAIPRVLLTEGSAYRLAV